MEFTYEENIFSDLYKDVYGFRPRGHEFYEAEPSRKQEIWDTLLDNLDRVLEEESEARELAIDDFEKSVAKFLSLGAENRYTAIKWIKDAEDCSGYLTDYDELEYRFNLPYGYIEKSLSPRML